MNAVHALHTPTSYPESRRPAHVHKLNRPEPLVRAQALAFLRFEKNDLVEAARFWTDFGLLPVRQSAEELVLRATGSAPAVLVARRGPKSRYVGAAFTVPSNTDFSALQSQSGARPLASHQIPGGGRGIELTDPNGHAVWLIADGSAVDPIPARQPTHETANTVGQIKRVNNTVRPPIEPAAVARLGHVVLQTTDYATMAHWYMRHLGLIPTDVQYLEDGSPTLTFFRLDLGDTPADHHSVVIAGGLENRYEHSAWEVVDVDALGQGQQVLQAAGHRHMWGIGRHVLGSQLFDYWYDPDGMEFEHYADGDVFTADFEPHYSPFDFAGLWAWGDDVPSSMRPAKTPAILWRVIRLLRSGKLSLQRLKLLSRVADQPPRPWL